MEKLKKLMQTLANNETAKKRLAEIKEKFKNYGFWLSLSGAIVYLLQACGLNIEQPVVEGVVNGVCGVLIVLGIINNPNEGKFY